METPQFAKPFKYCAKVLRLCFQAWCISQKCNGNTICEFTASHNPPWRLKTWFFCFFCGGKNSRCNQKSHPQHQRDHRVSSKTAVRPTFVFLFFLMRIDEVAIVLKGNCPNASWKLEGCWQMSVGKFYGHISIRPQTISLLRYVVSWLLSTRPEIPGGRWRSPRREDHNSTQPSIRHIRHNTCRLQPKKKTTPNPAASVYTESFLH